MERWSAINAEDVHLATVRDLERQSTCRIKHECNLRPTFTQNYQHQMRERHKKNNTSVRHIRIIDNAGVLPRWRRFGKTDSAGGVGVGARGAFGDLIVSSSVRFFSFLENKNETSYRHFREYGFESYATQIDAISSSTKNCLLSSVEHHVGVLTKDVLAGIAFLHKSGEQNGL